jgi:hypothetical protein
MCTSQCSSSRLCAVSPAPHWNNTLSETTIAARPLTVSRDLTCCRKLDLLVGCGRPEVLAQVAHLFPLGVTLSVDDLAGRTPSRIADSPTRSQRDPTERNLQPQLRPHETRPQSPATYGVPVP